MDSVNCIKNNKLAGFSADTKVLTNTGYKNISNIEIGDMVLTHKGRFKPVISLIKAKSPYKMVTFKSPFLIEQICSTLDHTFYNGDNTLTNAEDVTELYFLKCNDMNKPNETIDIYDYVKNITKKDGSKAFFADDDYVYSLVDLLNRDNGNITTTKKDTLKRYINIDEDFSYFIGLFINNGSIYNNDINDVLDINSSKIRISSLDTIELDKKVLNIKKILNDVFGIEYVFVTNEKYEATSTNNQIAFLSISMYLHCDNAVMSNFLYNLCFRQSKEQYFAKQQYTIPSIMYNTDIKNKYSLLLGLNTNDMISYYTLDKSFLNDIQALLYMCNIPTIYQYEKSFHKLKLTNGINEHVNVTNTITNFIKEVVPYDGLVYNISVMDDDSYVVNNVIVHS